MSDAEERAAAARRSCSTRLEQRAREARGDRRIPTRRSRSSPSCAEIAKEVEARAPAAQARGGVGCARLTSCARSSRRTSSELALTPGARRARRVDALRAGRRRQARPAGALPRGRRGASAPSRGGAAGGGGARARAQLLARPRRPAGARRRRASGAAGRAPGRQYGEAVGDPRRRRAARRGVPARALVPVAGGRARARARRRSG